MVGSLFLVENDLKGRGSVETNMQRKMVTIEIEEHPRKATIDPHLHGLPKMNERKQIAITKSLLKLPPARYGTHSYTSDSLGNSSSRRHWGFGRSDFDAIGDHLQYRSIAEAISTNLHYPGILAGREIGGVVNARIEFKDGRCTFDASAISSLRPELRLYIFSVLKTACRHPIQGFSRAKKATTMDLSFYFNTFSSERQEPKIVGNVILFELPGSQQRATWKLGPFQGSYFFPNWIFLNPTWINENWERLIESKDPASEYLPTEEQSEP